MKLIAAIDSSEFSHSVLNEILKRPWPPHTTLCILHVIDLSQLPDDPLLSSRAMKFAADLTTSASKKFEHSDLQVTTKILQGHPRTTIAQYARETKADLVLVGSHGANGMVRFLMGSTAQAALRTSSCSVEIVRKPTPRLGSHSVAMTILLAVDGSTCSMAAAKSIADRPWPNGTEVRIISVIPIVLSYGEGIPSSVAPIYPSPELVAILEKQLRSRAREAISRARQVLGEAHIRIAESDLQPLGDAREAILDEAKLCDADLIVLGSHGLRRIDRLLLGSVSESVAMHAHCSVEVIRTTTNHEST